MRGDLSETSVADLCRGLSAAGATGAVDVETAAGDARIFFRSGNVYRAASPTPRARLGDRLVNADLLGQDDLDQALEAQRAAADGTKLGALLVERGLVSRDAIRVFVLEQILDAVFEMVQWREGSYAFRPGEVADEKLPVDIPVDQLLVEVARRQSEWDQIQSVIPDLDMVPDFVRGGSSANAALEPDEFAVLASVDGARSIRELADALGYSTFEAARIVYGLTLLGIVDVRSDDDPSEATDEALAAGDVGSGDVGPGDVGPGDLSAAEDAGEVDVASALEEAVGSGAAAPEDTSPTERPRVRLHVDDDVTGYVAPHEPSEPVPADGPQEPEQPDDTDALDALDELGALDELHSLDELGTLDAADGSEDRSIEDLTAELTAGLDDGEDDEDDEEPEPWVAGSDVPSPSPTEDLGFFAGSTAPASARGRDLPDEEFDALLSELGAPADDTATPPAASPGASAGDDEPAASPEPPAADHAPAGPATEDDTPEPSGAEEPAPSEARRPSGGGDVSEFLRELSQLAVDDPPANANPGPTRPAPRPAEPEPSADEEPPPARPTREEDRRAAAEKRDDRSKKRGLFGWGR